MRVSTALVAGALAASVEAKNYLGFNSGSTLADNSAKFKADFQEEFETAQKLKNAPGTFNSVRLYTNIQAYSDEDPIEAFDAAVETETYLLLGVWASGVDNIDKEISALNKALKTYGDKLAKLVIGVSIGSEDLYRVSSTGLKNDPDGVGNGPDEIVGFMKDFRKAFANTGLADVPVGHVDTWDVWVNGTNKAVIDAADWIGVDEYPYYENDKGNDIKNSGSLFDSAYEKTLGAAGDKPVWVTETGWPYTGPKWDEAVASVKNAKYYWDEVGCRKLFNKTPTFWYTLRDSNPDNEMKFAITKDLSTTPMFDLSCPDTFDTDKKTTTSKEASTKTKTVASESATDASTTTFSAPSSTSTKSGSDSGSSSGSGSDSDSSSGSGSKDESSGDSTTGSGSGASVTTPAGGATTPSVTPEDAATSVQLMSKAAYAALALVAGVALL